MNKQVKKYQTWDNLIISEFKKDNKFLNYSLKESLKEYEKTGDLHILLIALKHIVKAKGICNIAEKSKLSRQALYKALSSRGNPTINSLQSILKALNYTFTFKPIH